MNFKDVSRSKLKVVAVVASVALSTGVYKVPCPRRPRGSLSSLLVKNIKFGRVEGNIMTLAGEE